MHEKGQKPSGLPSHLDAMAVATATCPRDGKSLADMAMAAETKDDEPFAPAAALEARAEAARSDAAANAAAAASVPPRSEVDDGGKEGGARAEELGTGLEAALLPPSLSEGKSLAKEGGGAWEGGAVAAAAVVPRTTGDDAVEVCLPIMPLAPFLLEEALPGGREGKSSSNEGGGGATTSGRTADSAAMEPAREW